MSNYLTSIKYHLIAGSKDLVKVAGVVAVVALGGGILFYHVSKQIEIIQLGYKIAEATTEHSRLLEKNKKLTLEISIQGRDTESIKEVEERLKLHPPTPGQTKKLPKSLLEQ